MKIGDSDVHLLAQTSYANGNNLINRLAALSALADSNAPGKKAALTGFYADSEPEALVSAQMDRAAGAGAPSTRRMRERMMDWHSSNYDRSSIQAAQEYLC